MDPALICLRTVTSLECLYHSPYPRSALQSCPGSFKPLYVIFPYVLHLHLSWQNSTEGCVQSTIQPVDSQKRKVFIPFHERFSLTCFLTTTNSKRFRSFSYLHISSFTRRKFQILFLFFSPSLFLFISEKRTYPFLHERSHKKTERNLILYLGIFR